MATASFRKVPLKASVVAAALCVAGAAHAQSSVTLYGIADAGLMYQTHTAPAAPGGPTPHQFSLTNAGYSPSLFGMMGTEDLGGGLKATFKLESGIDLSNGGFDNPGGGHGLFNRTADVGLSSDRFGTLLAGLQISPFFDTVYELDPRSAAEFGSALTPNVDNAMIATIFMPNAVTYTSPNIAGFQVAGLFGLGGIAGNFQAGRSWSVSGKYTNGTLLVGAAYISVNNGNMNTNGLLTNSGLAAVNSLLLANVRAWTAGASYKLDTVTVKASFTNYKANSAPVPNFSTDTSVNMYTFGADWFALPYLDLNGAVYYQDDRVHSGSHSITAAIGTQFFLSKRTALYAQVGLVNNKCSADGACLGSGLSVESGGSALGAMNGLGTLGFPAGTTVAGNVGVRVMF